LYIYCKTNFSTQKTKDLVAIHTQKYNEILNQIQESNAREKAELVQKLTMTDTPSPPFSSSFDATTPETHLSETDLAIMQREMDAFIQDTQL